MDRVGKGISIKTHINDYCVVDLETTGVFVNSAEIIEISALKVRNNEVVGEFSELINPRCHIPAEATAVNNITDEMVKDAPIMNDVIDAFCEFVGNDVIVGYNNAGFDMNLIYDALMELRNIAFTNKYIDILYVARRCLTGLENHKLETVSKYYSLDTSGEHRALKDCYLTKECYENLYEEFGNDAFKPKKSKSSDYTTHFSAETLALRELQSLLEIIVKDNKVSIAEFSALKEWMMNHRDLQGNYPFDRVFNALDNVLEDGIINSDELTELNELFVDFIDPIKSRGCHEKVKSFEGTHICITGDFNYGNRSTVTKLIENIGGIVDKSVKKATNYVVVGSKGSENWKTGNYGSKIQKAMEMIDKGIDIKIIEEDVFIPDALRILEIDDISEEERMCNKVTTNQDWKQGIREMLETLIEEFELPVGSLYLSDNYGKSGENKGKLISHSVCIWEPNYPAMKDEKPGQNKIVVTITPSTAKSRPNDLDMVIREVQAGDLEKELPESAEVLKRTKSDIDTGMIRIRITQHSDELVEYIRKNTIYCVEGYVSKATPFGCCSAFTKCSDAKKCVHENKLYSKACMYRSNLDSGRIFYGKNRNIDEGDFE